MRQIRESLVRRAREGDAAAATELFQRHWSSAWRIAFALTRDRALADDVAQVALIRAFANLDRFDVSRPFAPWLNRIVGRTAIDHLRARPHWAPEGYEFPEQAERGHDLGDLGEQLADAVLALDEDRRVIVVLRYWGDLGIDEIATLLGKAPGTVASRLSRGLAELRRTIEEGTHAR